MLCFTYVNSIVNDLPGAWHSFCNFNCAPTMDVLSLKFQKISSSRKKKNGEKYKEARPCAEASSDIYITIAHHVTVFCLLPLTCASAGLSVGVAYQYSVCTRLGKSSKRLLLRESQFQRDTIESTSPEREAKKKKGARINRPKYLSAINLSNS